MKARRPWLRVVVASTIDSAWIVGAEARDLIVECGGTPIWDRRRKAWHCSAGTASDVLALAEHRGTAISFQREAESA